MHIGKILSETLIISKSVGEHPKEKVVRYMMIGRRVDEKGEKYSFNISDGVAKEEDFKEENPFSTNFECRNSSNSLELTKDELNEFIERLKELKEANK